MSQIDTAVALLRARDETIAALKAALAERDTTVRYLRSLLAEADDQIATRDATIQELTVDLMIAEQQAQATTPAQA